MGQWLPDMYNIYGPQSKGDNVIGRFCPSVRLCVWVYSGHKSPESVCLSVCHYRSEGFVCLSVTSRAYADNRADAVDRLLIFMGETKQL